MFIRGIQTMVGDIPMVQKKGKVWMPDKALRHDEKEGCHP